jgi:GNAT superfamily N-acetyltransferase
MIESFEDVYRDIMPLFEHHNAELNDESMPFVLDLDLYISLDRINKLITCVKREKGVPIAFLVGIVDEHVHHMGHFVLTTDSFHVIKSHRKSGVAAEMFREIEEECKKQKISRWMALTKAKTTAGDFMEKMGFELEELMFMRKI